MNNSTAETRRHGGERSGHREIARDRVIGENLSAFFSASPRLRGELAFLIIRSLNPCYPDRHRAMQERGKVEGPRASVLYHAASGGFHETKLSISRWLCSGWCLLRATLREIFDESAYDRFLLRTQRQHSVESYRAFMIERDTAAATKPRCC